MRSNIAIALAWGGAQFFRYAILLCLVASWLVVGGIGWAVYWAANAAIDAAADWHAVAAFCMT